MVSVPRVNATMEEATIERRASRGSGMEGRDEQALAEFGYKQELKRDWGLTHNFGISFSIIVSPYSANP